MPLQIDLGDGRGPQAATWANSVRGVMTIGSPIGKHLLLWPWLDPIFYGRPLRVTARAWFAFWGRLPEVLRERRRIYAGRTVPVSRLLSLLESPWGDMARAWRALPRRLGALLKVRPA